MAKKRSPLMVSLLQELGPEVGAEVTVEPRWKIAGQIAFPKHPTARPTYFHYTSLGINQAGSAAICKDKDYATFFMRRMGFRAVPGKLFFRDDFAQAIGSKQNTQAAIAYGEKIGFPLFVKPNDGSQGRGAALVGTARELRGALKVAFLNHRTVLVQKVVKGRDYRVVVFNDKIYCAYERVPLNVVGNGRSTIRELLGKKVRSFVGASRNVKIDPADPRITNKLKRQKLSMRSILPRGQQVFLLDNANLSGGGDALDMTTLIHPGFKKIASDVTRALGLRLCGVDLMIEGDITHAPDKYWILELNAAPGLDHFAQLGQRQLAIAKELYRDILLALAKRI